MVADSGAEVSSVSKTTYETFKHIFGPTTPTSTSFLGADGEQLKTWGMTSMVEVTWQEHTIKARFLVLQDLGKADGLLGMDIMQRLRICIDTYEKKLVSQFPEPVLLRLAENQVIPPKSETVIQFQKPWADAAITEPWHIPETLVATPCYNEGKTAYMIVGNPTEEKVALQKEWTIARLTPALVPEQSAHNEKKGSIVPQIPDHLSAGQWSKLWYLFRKFTDIMSQSEDDYGRTTLIKHEIHTEGPPQRQPYRRQPPKKREHEERIVDQMAKAGIISPSSSPYSASVVLVEKKGGGYRLACDFRRLNAQTTKDPYSLPRIDDTLEALHGSKWFATLDFTSSYHAIPIRNEDKYKTAFVTSSGKLWEFNYMPFGVCNGSQTYSRLMHKVLEGLQWKTCLSFLDDVIIFALTFSQLVERLREVFIRIREANLKLKPSKCKIAHKELTFLGHRIQEGGIGPDSKKLEAIRELPTPKNADLRSDYLVSIENFAHCLQPLRFQCKNY